MKIRKVENKDLKQLVELYNKFLIYLGKFGRFVKDKNSKRDSKIEIEKALEKRIKNKNKNIFLVAEEEKLLGFVEARIMPSKESKTNKIVVEMVDIYVIPRTKKGIGKKLFREVAKWARLKNANFISWEFLYGNKKAEKFCIKNKFKHFRVEMLKKLK